MTKRVGFATKFGSLTAAKTCFKWYKMRPYTERADGRYTPVYYHTDEVACNFVPGGVV